MSAALLFSPVFPVIYGVSARIYSRIFASILLHCSYSQKVRGRIGVSRYSSASVSRDLPSGCTVCVHRGRSLTRRHETRSPEVNERNSPISAILPSLYRKHFSGKAPSSFESGCPLPAFALSGQSDFCYYWYSAEAAISCITLCMSGA